MHATLTRELVHRGDELAEAGRVLGGRAGDEVDAAAEGGEREAAVGALGALLVFAGLFPGVMQELLISSSASLVWWFTCSFFKVNDD